MRIFILNMQGLITGPKTEFEIIVSGRQDMQMRESRYLERLSLSDKPCFFNSSLLKRLRHKSKTKNQKRQRYSF